MQRTSFWLLFLSLILWLGCSAASTTQQTAHEVQKMPEAASPTPSPQPRPYSKNIDDVRVAFNKDKDKVRLVTLLSPT